jgi:diaminopimelate decarboxylase
MKNIAGNSYIKKENNQIFLDLVPLKEILDKMRTPLYIILENRIRENIKTFLRVFKDFFNNLNCLYSIKANFLPEICEIVKSENIGVEIVSLPELKLALNLKFPPEKIVVGGPYLRKELIEKCLENKVREIIIYNLDDIKKIDVIAKSYNQIQDICIRINSGKYNSKLGINLNKKNLTSLRKIIEECQNIRLTTLLSHYSTQMNNIDLFKDNVRNLAQNLILLSKSGIEIENINLGGGFPESTVMNQKQLKKLALEISLTLNECNLSPKNVYFEPGRYFVGDAGLFITKIIRVIDNRNIFLNIGNNLCPRFARCSLRFYNVSKIDFSHNEPTTFLGIIPTDQDVLAKDYFFTKDLTEGDKVLITNTGAYCLTFSNRFPYPLPKLLLIKDQKFTVIFNPDLDKDFSLR